MRESVVLPAPDGEDRTSINPRRGIETFGAGDFEAVFFLAPFFVSGFLVSALLASALLASAFLPPVLLRLVFFWPAFVAGVFAILTPRSACPAPLRFVLFGFWRYSRFCTCSRNCSTTVLSSSPILVSATSFDFEQSVLASRLSSCDRKSSLRPTALPSAIKRFAWATCEARRSSSSRISALLAIRIAS